MYDLNIVGGTLVDGTGKGLDVRCQVGARGIGVMLGLQATFHPFMGFPSYKAINPPPLADSFLSTLDAVHEMLTHPLALPGLSDGGAHVGTICDASFTTFPMRARDCSSVRETEVVQ